MPCIQIGRGPKKHQLEQFTFFTYTPGKMSVWRLRQIIVVLSLTLFQTSYIIVTIPEVSA